MNYSRSRNQSECAGDEAGSAKASIAIEAEVGLLGRLALRIDDFFLREDAFDAEGHLFTGKAMPDAEFFAHFLQQPIVRGDGEVSDLNLRRIATPCRCAGGNYGNAAFAAAGNQKTFAGRTINRIEHEIEMSLQDFRGVRFQKEGVQGMHNAIGIYRFYAARHHVNFRFPKFAFQRVELAIGIADADVIEIDQRKRTDTGTSKRFDCPGTDAAKPNDADVGTGNSFQTFGRVKACKGVEARKIGTGVRLSHAPRRDFIPSRSRLKRAASRRMRRFSSRFILRRASAVLSSKPDKWRMP